MLQKKKVILFSWQEKMMNIAIVNAENQTWLWK